MQDEENKQDFQQGNSEMMEKYSPFNPKNDAKIQVSVSDPILKKETLTSYTAYSIKGSDEKGAFETLRRYNEFFVLRQILVQNWPGCFIPPIPAKKAIGNSDGELVEDRKRHLDYFCQKMASIPHLWDSDEFQIFLKGKDSDCVKRLEKLPKANVSEIVEKYKRIFSDLNGKDIDSDITIRISGMLGFLKKVKAQLHQYRITTQEIARSKQQYNKKLTGLFDQLIPQYETNCFSEYVGADISNMVFTNEKQIPKSVEIKQKLIESKDFNPFIYLYDMICFEYRDCEAFTEAINQKDYYEKRRTELQTKIRDLQEELTNLNQGKKTLKSVFSTNNVDDRKQSLELNIQKFNAEVDNTTDLIALITGILGYIEVGRFKDVKKDIYYQVMKSVASMESVNSLQLMTMWNEIGSLASELLEKK